MIVPPSIHPSGAEYSWQVPLEQATIAECPEWVLERLVRPVEQKQGRSAEAWLEVISRPVLEGRRNETLASVAGLLFRKLPAMIAAELAYCWAQVKLSPPLSQQEVQRAIDSIAGRELRREGGSS